MKRSARASLAAWGLSALLGLATGGDVLAEQRAGEPAAESGPVRLSFPGYLALVARANLDLLAQRANIPIAQAQIAVAKVFPDPQLTAGWVQYDFSGQGNPTESFLQLSVPVQIAGQRGARVAAAEAGLRAVQDDVDDFLRALRGTAANAYVDALQKRLILERQQKTLTSLLRLVTANEQRLRAGDIGEVALIQSRVEAQQFRALVMGAAGDVRVADLQLLQSLGSAAPALLSRQVELAGELRPPDRSFEVEALVRGALAQRPDLRAARQRSVVAERQITLARRNRVPDITLSGTWQHNFPVSGTYPQPGSDLLGGSLSVPIPLSRIYRGELDAAYATRGQAQAQARSAAVRIEVEVRQALAHYEASVARVRLYKGGVLSDADSVLERTLYNYQRGGASLVEVLVAQRTENDVYLSYFDALADAAHALVGVEQASGIWDIEF